MKEYYLIVWDRESDYLTFPAGSICSFKFEKI